MYVLPYSLPPFRLPRPTSARDFSFNRGVKLRPGGVSAVHHHQGIDLLGPVGTPIVSIGEGVVTHAHGGSGALRGFSGYGRVVVIAHPSSVVDLSNQPVEVRVPRVRGYSPIYSLYAHLDYVDVHPGQRVLPGTRLGIMGTTGFTTAEPDRRVKRHLHFELAATPYPKGFDRRAADHGRIHPGAFLELNAQR
jgi:murein DD-endopeptidase MepM/ murein hydrolase activator NlpD